MHNSVGFGVGAISHHRPHPLRPAEMGGVTGGVISHRDTPYSGASSYCVRMVFTPCAANDELLVEEGGRRRCRSRRGSARSHALPQLQPGAAFPTRPSLRVMASDDALLRSPRTGAPWMIASRSAWSCALAVFSRRASVGDRRPEASRGPWGGDVDVVVRSIFQASSVTFVSGRAGSRSAAATFNWVSFDVRVERVDAL